jgi:hypothetical protein
MNETFETDRDTHVVSSYKTFNTRCSDPVIPCSVEQSCASAMCLARLAAAHKGARGSSCVDRARRLSRTPGWTRNRN